MKSSLCACLLLAGLVSGVLPAGGQRAPDAEAGGGWVKYTKNPVLGGPLGTCFDVSVLRDGGKYRMWFSWRPRRSIALVESKDGLAWGDPFVALGPHKASGWEDEVNRPSSSSTGTSTGCGTPGRPGASRGSVPREAGREAAEVVTIGTDGLQRRPQAPQLFCRPRRQPEGAAPRAVAEVAELAERDGEWRDGRAGAPQCG